MSIGLTITFLKEFGAGLELASPLLLFLAMTIAVLGQLAGRREGWSRFDRLYWSFVTATTLGYGDLKPTTRLSKAIAVIIAVLGLLLSGIFIAIAVRAATVALQTLATGM
jgi:voltage-gated potassium channel